MSGGVISGWEPHPTQIDTTMSVRGGFPKYLHGPTITPEVLDDGISVRACVVTGHCGQGEHGRCWQASGVTPPAHSLGACQDTHRLRCRCTCHETARDDGGCLF